jgi:hypothetical protein
VAVPEPFTVSLNPSVLTDPLAAVNVMFRVPGAPLQAIADGAQASVPDQAALLPVPVIV